MEPQSKDTRGRRYSLISLLLLAFTMILLFYHVDPKEVVQTVGVEKGYIFVFLAALLGGVSTLTFGSYIGTVALLATGGLDPYYLVCASGLGVFVGGSVYFYIGQFGRAFLGGGWMQTMTDELSGWLDTKAKWTASALTYVYASFTPFPNDVLTIAMGLAGRRYVAIIIPLVVGHMTHITLIALFGTKLSLIW